AVHPPAPHSFPTRRSSDLAVGAIPARAAADEMRRLVGASSPVRSGRALRIAATNATARTSATTAATPTASTGQSIRGPGSGSARSEEHTSELQSLAYLVCR